jgi:hypothetical protein
MMSKVAFRAAPDRNGRYSDALIGIKVMALENQSKKD